MRHDVVRDETGDVVAVHESAVGVGLSVQIRDSRWWWEVSDELGAAAYRADGVEGECVRALLSAQAAARAIAAELGVAGQDIPEDWRGRQ